MTSNQHNFINLMAGNIEEIMPTLPADIILFIACQSALESGFGTSELCELHHNYFGMKNPLSRPSTSIVCGNSQFEFAEYVSCTSSIVDYFLCLTYRRPLLKEVDTLKHFSSFIHSWYCPEADYINKIFNIMSNFKSYKDEQRISKS